MKPIISTFLICIILISCKQNTQIDNVNPVSNTSNAIQILDSNNDGIINPYEALDILLQLQKDNKKDISIQDFTLIASDLQKEKEEEFLEFFNEFDKNKDGKIEFDEASDDMKDVVMAMDSNNDKFVTLSEMKSFDFEDDALASKEEINNRIEEIFSKYDNKDTIELSKVPQKKIGRFSEWDTNRDEKVTKKEAYDFMIADNTPVKFFIKDTTAYMSGVITSALPSKILKLLFEHPEVTTIEMTVVPGSIDDEANLRACLYVNEKGLTTKLNSRSMVASGGTDFFLSGKKRIVEEGAKLGVHSWGGGNVAATDVPKDDPVHTKYIEFYKKVGVPVSFYWYTLEVAPASEIHMMTKEEIEIYKVRK